MRSGSHAWLTLAFLAVVAGIASPGFFAGTNLLNLVQQSGITALLGVGLTFVIVSGGIDLSVGSVVALAGVLAGTVAVSTGSAMLGALTGVGAGAAVGLVNGALVAGGRIPPFIATLGTMLVARSAAKVFTNASPVSGLPASFLWLASEPLGVPLVIWAVALAYGLAHAVLTRTTLGRYTYAIGGNEQAAWISGVPIGRTKVSVYAISGALAGVASVLLTARLNAASPLAGEMYELYAIAAAVIGGVSLSGGDGRILGTLIGALIMALLRNGLNALNVPSAWEGVVVGGVVVIAALVDRARGTADAARQTTARRWGRAAVAVLAVALLAGAVFHRTRAATPIAGERTFTVAFAPKSVGSPFWVAMLDAAATEAQRWNAKVIALAPDRETDVDAQHQIVENVLAQGVDAIVIAPCGGKEILPALKKANDARVPIIVVDSDVDRAEAERLGVTTTTYVGSDNVEGGRLAGKLMVDALGGSGEVAIVQGTPGHESTDARERGFREALTAQGGGVRVVAVQAANADRARAFAVTQNLLEAHPNLRGVFGANDEMALGAMEAVDAAGKHPAVVVIGFDAAPDALTSIAQGRLRGSVAQYPSEMGRMAVEAAMKLVARGVAPPAILHTKVETITRENLPR